MGVVAGSSSSFEAIHLIITPADVNLPSRQSYNYLILAQCVHEEEGWDHSVVAVFGRKGDARNMSFQHSIMNFKLGGERWLSSIWRSPIGIDLLMIFCSVRGLVG